ncbi:MAG: hypothetical protein IJA23_05055 [Clostridia bacterium]|nr:hypothetical protein [Clostridia bacterium]
MLAVIEKQKIEKLKTQITNDLSKKITEEMVLPFAFTDAIKTGKGKYMISAPVFILDGKAYPYNLFWSYGVYADSIVAFLNDGYSSLGALYKTINDEWLPGIKAEKTNGNVFESYSTLLDFELDLRNNKYKIVDGKDEAANAAASQRGE